MALITRTLLDSESPGTIVTVSIELPIQTDGDWECAYCIDGMDIAGCVHGVDGLQALLLAVESVRQAIARSDRTLTWVIDGQPAADIGDPGIPKHVPTIVDRAEQMRINDMIDQSVERWLEERAKGAQTPGTR